MNIVSTDYEARIGNISNPFQTKAKRVLCVCSAGMLRSSTAANVIHRRFGYNTRAAGIAPYALIPLDEVLVRWADQIVCMGREHLSIVNDIAVKYGMGADVQCLNIPDEFEWMDEKLQALIVERYRP